MHELSGTPRVDADSEARTFESFFEDERRRLFRALLLVVGNAAEAEELTQDAFLKVWERWDRVATMADPVGYLFRTAMNLSRSRFRRIARAAKHGSAVHEDPDPFVAVDRHDVVVRALSTMATRQRQALVLTELLDLETAVAAEMMSVTPSTVRSLVSEAHRTMRAAMEGDDDD